MIDLFNEKDQYAKDLDNEELFYNHQQQHKDPDLMVINVSEFCDNGKVKITNNI